MQKASAAPTQDLAHSALWAAYAGVGSALDYYEIQATIPAEEAFQLLAKSDCPLVRK